MPRRKPHLVVLMADQLAAPFLAAYGHKVVRTPAIDKLAASGVVFENAYTPSPLCAPARAIFMSGRLPSRTGVYDNAAEFPSAVPTFAHYLRQEGYRTVLSGKMHFVGPDQLHGFEERLTTDIYPADFGWTPDWRLKQERIDWWYHNMTSVKQAGTAQITNQLEYDDEVAFHAVRRIYDHARYDAGTPLCLVVSFTHPHDPYVARPEFWNLYRDEDIDMPLLPAVPVADLDPHSRRLWQVSAVGEHEVTAEDVRSSRHGYYASISYIDRKFAEIIAALTETGLVDDCVVLVTSDHGDFLGERGLWYKMSFLEHSARVPLIAWSPGRLGAGRRAAPASLADVAPTLVDLARPGAAAGMVGPLDGESLLPLMTGADNPERTIHGEYLAEGVLAPMFMIRTGRWKFIHTATDPDQLFDLAGDPLEQANLASSPEHAGRIAAFRADIARRYDEERLAREVMASQQARLLLFQSLSNGKQFPWDFQPLRDASLQYTRNRQGVTERDQLSRFPKAPTP
jgi:choline-sulfatase